MAEINPHIGVSIDEYIEENIKLAYFVAERFRNKIEYDDAVQLALVGMMKAYRKFDPTEFKTKFSTYAVPLMEGEILRYLRDSSTMIKYPRVFKDIWNKVKRMDLSEASYEEISEKIGIELRFVEKAMPYYNKRQVVSTDKVVNEGDNKSITIADWLKTEEDYTYVFAEEAKSQLSERDRMIFEMRYEKELTQGEIGRIIGVSQVQVSRLEKKIISQLKEYVSQTL